MPVPYARTLDEAYLYMDMRPCPCGETSFERSSTRRTGDNGAVHTFTGVCPSCDRRREFSFRMPDKAPDLDFEIDYGGPDGRPSELLDPGEWLGIAEMYEALAQDRLSDAADLDDEELTRTYYLLSSAIAATDEVIKFLAPGGDAIPGEAFFSQAGRLVYESFPDQFQRANLAAARQERARQLAEFEERYGDGPSGADG